MSTSTKVRVLLTNDDGPPSKDSPFILGHFLALLKNGYDVKVVIPSSQKSWIGKAYHIKEKITGRYYYPRHPDDSQTPETSDVSRPLKEGEMGEWILLDGTPATCANIGLHNLYPGEIDLVISGPNYGRNTSSAFVLSSGTIGAAMSSSLAMVRSIALSYGVFVHPNPPEYIQPAHDLGMRIINQLWKHWGKDATSPRNGEVELYNVNIPLVAELLQEGSLDVVWTKIWRNRYASLFKATSSKAPVKTFPGGPDTSKSATPLSPSPEPVPSGSGSSSTVTSTPSSAPDLAFHFAPQMSALVNPPIDTLPFGTDAWAVHHAKASVTPLRTSFAEPGDNESYIFADEAASSNANAAKPVENASSIEELLGKPWKWKL